MNLIQNSQPTGARALWGVPISRIIGLIITPLLISAVFIWGLWDPSTRLEHVTAAVVNLDEPVEVDGQLTPLGRVLAGELVGSVQGENFDWELTSQEEAIAGLENGKYITVVTIPENFSAAATSLSDGPAQAEHAYIDIQTSEKAKLLDPALSAAVTNAATKVINDQLGKAFVENIFVGMNQLGDGIDQVKDGADELAGGAKELSGGVGEFAAGTGEYEAGVSEFAAGASDFSSGMSAYADGSSSLSAGAAELAAGVRELAINAEGLVAGNAELGRGADELAWGVGQYVGGINQILEPLNGYLDEIKGYSDEIVPALDGLITIIQDAKNDGLIDPVQADEMLAWIIGIKDQLGGVEGQLDQASKMLGDTIAGGNELAYGATGVAGGVNEITGYLSLFADGADQLAAGADELAVGASQLVAGAQGLAGGASELADGAYGLAGGASDLKAGADQLADGSGQLASGSGELAEGIGTIAEEIPRYTDAETQRFAEIVIEPVRDGSGKMLLFSGSGAPLFVTLALWAGALASFLLLRPLWPRTREAALSEATITVKSVTPGAILGALQGIIVGIVVGVVLSLNALPFLNFVFLTTVIGIVFALMNQALVALLGGYGKFISIVILTIGFVAGILSTAPGILETISEFTPFGVAVANLNSVLATTGSSLGSIVWLIVWGVLGFVLTGWAVHRRRIKSV
ncbi:MAG TPA: YhgE/Pip domain-containing protein [Microbacteriaceae bacterium]|nr:YhgE/Pip domain-containing protein [Microbacteriaceae bacterium]